MSMNGTTSSSTIQNITVRSREAAYSYKIGSVPGYEPDSSSGEFNLTANRVITIQFTSTRALQLAADERSMILLLTTSGVAWSLVAVAAVVKTLRKRRSDSQLEPGLESLKILGRSRFDMFRRQFYKWKPRTF